MEESAIQIKCGITINADVGAKTYMLKRLYLESCYM